MIKTTSLKLDWDNLEIEQAEFAQKITSDVVDLVYHCLDLTSANSKLIELGSGNGILSFMAEHKRPDMKIDAVEIQKELVDLAIENKRKINSKVNFHHQDLRKLTSEEKYDYLITNPPHLPLGKFRTSPNKFRAISRNEVECNLNDILSACQKLLKKGGFGFLLYPKERDSEIKTELKNVDLRLNHSFFYKKINNGQQVAKNLVAYVVEK